jgi:cardiolipin synthase
LIAAITLVAVYVKSGDVTRQHIDEIISLFVHIFFVFMIVSVIYIIIRKNEDPVITLAWIQILVFLPVVGFILYIIFGVNYRKKRIFSQKYTEDSTKIQKILTHCFAGNHDEVALTLVDKNPQIRIIKLLYNNNKAHLTIHNRIKIYLYGKDVIQAIFDDLENADDHIHMEYFSIANDETGRKLREILIRKATAGVKVRLIYDAVGSWRLNKGFLQPMEDAGVEFRAFMKVKVPFLSSKLNYRNHRKIAIIDGKLAYAGGVNIGNKYVGKSDYYGNWRDTHLKIMGDAVYSLQKEFLLNWTFLNGENLDYSQFFPRHDVSDILPTQIVSSGPDSDWENIMQAYFSAISRAQEYIYIATPYLVLTDSMLTALKTAALSDVDVRMVLPSFPDHRTVFYGSRSYFSELLRAGVRIYLYESGFMHSKVLLADDSLVSVGTANLDIRSFKQNFEINSIIYNQDFALRIKRNFMDDFRNSREINLNAFSNRSKREKIIESFSRLLSPLL